MSKKKNVSHKTHRSILKRITPSQAAYIISLMKKNRLLQREAIYYNATSCAEREYYPRYGTAYSFLSGTDTYKALNTDIARAILKMLYESYKSTYEHWKTGNKNVRCSPSRAKEESFTKNRPGKPKALALGGSLL